jgi:glycine oxidase
MRDADVVVVGAGIVGLASAVALAERDADVVLVDDPRPGAASGAAAGLLAPSIGTPDGGSRAFGLVARDRYPAFVDMIRERVGISVPLDRGGVLQLALDEREAEALLDGIGPDAEWLDRGALRRMEPALGDAAGAVLHRDDGLVDNVVLLDALARLAAASPRIRRVHGAVVEVEADRTEQHVVARTADGRAIESGRLVLAAGAWVAGLRGLPRPLPVEPVRGQILLLDAAPLRHAAFGADGYVLPRGAGRTLVGSTAERAGFDASTTAVGIATLARTATRLCPALFGAPPVAEWAGLRPMTPDLLPIIGVEPRAPAVIYACGHSRNGILGAPLTGECVAALACGERPPVSLAPFAPDRFGG